jgi:hypothetical protein
MQIPYRGATRRRPFFASRGAGLAVTKVFVDIDEILRQ